MDIRDIDAFIAEAQSKPAGEIEQIPEMQTYEMFVYQVVAKRSPFDKPVSIYPIYEQAQSALRPNLTREKQLLEAFDISVLNYVGSISNAQGIWGLVEVDGGIYKVRVGDYVGRLRTYNLFK